MWREIYLFKQHLETNNLKYVFENRS
jgi:hypothetical protein